MMDPKFCQLCYGVQTCKTGVIPTAISNTSMDRDDHQAPICEVPDPQTPTQDDGCMNHRPRK